MYLYRALNIFEDKEYKQNKSIKARKIAQTANEMINDIAEHMAKASSADQKDCWISTGKELNTIIKEYAIPQGGNYNTGDERKNIAVIDLAYWKQVNSTDECYTVFLNGGNKFIDFSTFNTKREHGKRNIIMQIKSMVDQNFLSGDIRALFDCSQKGDYSSPFNKMSIMRFSKARKGFKLFDRGLTGIQNGIAQKAKEVLCYKEIPAQAIVNILLPIQQDILYLLNEQEQADFIQALNRDIKVDWDETINAAVIYKNNQTINVPGKKWMYPGMIYEEVAKQYFNNSYTYLEKMYNDFSKEKRDFLVSIIKELGFEYNKDKNIPEDDGLWVYDFDKNNNPIERNKDQLYDLVLLKYKEQLYAMREIKDFNGIKLIGQISKKTDGVINQLIRDRKLMCRSLQS